MPLRFARGGIFLRIVSADTRPAAARLDPDRRSDQTCAVL